MTRSVPPTTPSRRICGLASAAAFSSLLAGGVMAPSTAAAVPSAPVHQHHGTGLVQHELNQLVGDDTFPGALAAVRDRRGPIRSYTAGVADLTTHRPVPANGHVRIASNTKTFTATVVLQLVGEGKVRLDSPVETYLPGLLRGEGIDGHHITVRQLLQHTSGLPDYVPVIYADGFEANRYRHFEPRKMLSAALTQPANFAPGTQWSYSNTNYLVAGLLIEEVTGRPVGEEITRRIIRPLHLHDTYWPAKGEYRLRGRHPQGYAVLEPGGKLVDVTAQDVSAPWAAGALVSTPKDLLRFFTALVQGRVLPPHLLKEMQTTVRVPADANVRATKEGYGLGLQTFTLSCGGTAWTHGGDIEGFETRQAVTRDGRGVTLAVTALPQSLKSAKQVEDTVDAIMCRRS